MTDANTPTHSEGEEPPETRRSDRLTLNLPPSIRDRARAAARDRGLAWDEFILTVIEEQFDNLRDIVAAYDAQTGQIIGGKIFQARPVKSARTETVSVSVHGLTAEDMATMRDLVSDSGARSVSHFVAAVLDAATPARRPRRTRDKHDQHHETPDQP